MCEMNFEITFNDNCIISDAYTSTETEAILKNLHKAQCEQTLHEIMYDQDGPNISSFNLGGMLSVKLPANPSPPPRYSERTLAILRPYLVARAITQTR
jgi:hypothetical protein